MRLKHHPVANTNHSYRHEILTDCILAIEQYSLREKTFPGVELTCVASTSRTTTRQGGWQLGCLAEGMRSYMASEWVILCTNRRLGAPRVFPVAGEASFAGAIRRGISDDALDLSWQAKRVLILGHGPYATENARTALEHAAAHITFGVRRHGIICPELVSALPMISHSPCPATSFIRWMS